MKNIFVVAILVVFSAVTLVAGSGTSPHTIDLNGPDVLDSLRRDNPQHYEKVSNIVSGLAQQPDAAISRWMQTDFDAHDVQYGPALLTSHPPQKHLSFTLDNTHYKATVTLTKARAEIVPTK